MVNNDGMEKTITSKRYKKLVQHLAQTREDKGMSLRELASRLDVPHSWVQRVEMLERRLDVFEYTEYCRAIGLDARSTLDYLE